MVFPIASERTPDPSEFINEESQYVSDVDEMIILAGNLAYEWDLKCFLKAGTNPYCRIR